MKNNYLLTQHFFAGNFLMTYTRKSPYYEGYMFSPKSSEN